MTTTNELPTCHIKSKLPTYRVEICLGLYPGYQGDGVPDPNIGDVLDQRLRAINVCRNYCDKVGLGVTITENRLVYTGGEEPGLTIGLINYPRFPRPNSEVLMHGFALAEKLLIALKQERLTVVETPGEAFLIDRDVD